MSHKCLPVLRCCRRLQTVSLALTPFEHVMMMQALPRKRVLIVNHENVTNCLYTGNQKNMLITNVLFRIGGACAIMSNRHANLPHVYTHTWCKLLRAPRPPALQWGATAQSLHVAKLELQLSSAARASPHLHIHKAHRQVWLCSRHDSAVGAKIG